jgi:DNA invertase Pin-like site-specific DNA recombinase
MFPPWESRATRSIIERIHARGGMIKALDKPHLDLTTPIGRGFIALLSALAEGERQRMVKPANDGRAAARRRGVHMGRKPKLAELQRGVTRGRVAKGESARRIAGEWGVAHTTVARAVT